MEKVIVGKIVEVLCLHNRGARKELSILVSSDLSSKDMLREAINVLSNHGAISQMVAELKAINLSATIKDVVALALGVLRTYYTIPPTQVILKILDEMANDIPSEDISAKAKKKVSNGTMESNKDIPSKDTQPIKAHRNK